jgi:hypothetical protein
MLPKGRYNAYKIVRNRSEEAKMGRGQRLGISIVALMGVTWLLASCAITASTTETVGNTVNASIKFTSSTSPGQSSSARDQKVYAFTAVNFARIREDMARGGGEYLTSLASLMGISASEQSAFFALTKESFPTLFSSDQTTPEELLTKLDQAMGADRDRAS